MSGLWLEEILQHKGTAKASSWHEMGFRNQIHLRLYPIGNGECKRLRPCRGIHRDAPRLPANWKVVVVTHDVGSPGTELEFAL